jgi:signal peptidase I
MKESSKTVLGLLFILTIIAILARIFLFNLAKTASYSMIPNIVPGDLFLVATRTKLGPGDIAVCHDPEIPKAMIVGRIVGVPGSTLRIANNDIFINGDHLQHQVEGQIFYEDNTGGEQLEYAAWKKKEFIGGHLFYIANMDRGRDRNLKKYKVRSGFYLLGDNRNVSRDSRHLGEIPIDSCIGSAVMILWPGPDSGDFKMKKRFLLWLD